MNRKRKFTENEDSKLTVPVGWKEPKFDKESNPYGRLFAESKFEVMYSKQLENYIKSTFKDMASVLHKYYINIELDSLNNKIILVTTRQTYDPAIIIKGRDMLDLISRSVPLDVAKRVLEDEIFSDIIDISGGNNSKKDTFLNRRARFIGEDSITLKTLEALTGCYVIVYGKTVACLGSFRGCNDVRQVALDCCIKNIHPLHSLRLLKVRRHLESIPEMADKSWDHLLPKSKSKSNKSKVVKATSVTTSSSVLKGAALTSVGSNSEPSKKKRRKKIFKEKKNKYELPNAERTPRKEDIMMAQGLKPIDKRKARKSAKNKHSKDINIKNKSMKKKE